MTQTRRRLRRAITLPKIAAALVGVIAFATIGAVVTLLATSLPDPVGGELVASAGNDDRPIREVSAQPSPATLPEQQAAVTAARVVPVAPSAVPPRQASVGLAVTDRLPQRSEVSASAAPTPAALDDTPVPGVDLPSAAAFVPTARATAAAAAITKFGQNDDVTTGGTTPRVEEPAGAKPAEIQKASVEPAARKPSGGTMATISSPVNLRSSTKNGKVLGVIPRGAEVQLSGACTHWCAVTYDGRSGFVYKSFIRR